MSTVRLVSHSLPCEPLVEEGVVSIEDMIAYCARVSNPANQGKPAGQLLRYCMKHGHWSIFEMANIVLEIETTRDIARQILRHRSFSFQEFSQRYADPTKELDFEWRETRLQDEKNRQNSWETDDFEIKREWQSLQAGTLTIAKQAYIRAISMGVAKEVARAVLPEGMTMSRMYMSGSVRSWIHYLQVRLDHSTQKEHRVVAQQCMGVIKEIFPLIEEILDGETGN